MESWKSMTLGDAARALSRYRPFLLVAAAILAVAVLLPGQQTSDDAALSTAGGTGVTAGGDAAATGADAGAGSDAAAAAGADGTVAGGASGVAGTTGGAGGVGGTGGGGAAGANVGTGPLAVPPGQVVANCDRATGRIKVPTKFAPPCNTVSGDNGGATAQGVSGDKIKLTLYRPKPDPATEAALKAAGAANEPEDTLETFKAYIKYFENNYNLHGRKIELSIKDGSGKSTDDAAAQADAIDIAKRIKPFAVTTAGGGGVLNSFSNTLAANKIICVCGVSQPAEFYTAGSPYLGYTTLMSSTQGYVHRAEYICKRLKTDVAKYAGFRDSPADPMNTEKRVYGLLYFETNDKAYKGGIDFFEQQLAKCGLRLKTRIEFIYPLPSVQERAAAQISRMKADGVTSVIFAGDPITPAIFSSEATKQRWFPEWILTGSALTDTTIFARTYDQSQWNRAFGVSYLPARFPEEQGDAYNVHVFEHGKPPKADNTYGVIYSTPFAFFTGVHMAGPKLTAQSFQAGLFKYPPTGRGSVTAQVVSFGKHGFWGNILDLTMYDDVTEIWWDPNATGKDEVGTPGKGMYRYVDGGKRYLPGEHPTSPPRVFDPANSPTFYDQRPPQDRAPAYKKGG